MVLFRKTLSPLTRGRATRPVGTGSLCELFLTTRGHAVCHLVATRVIGRTRWVMLATVFVSVGDCDEVLRVWGSFIYLVLALLGETPGASAFWP